MKQIICPNCHEAFTIDESQYKEIENQVRDEILKNELIKEKELIKKDYENALLKEKQKNESELNAKLNQQTSLIQDLKNQVEALKKDKATAVALEASKKDAEIAELKGKVLNAEQTTKLKIQEAIAKEQEKQSELKVENQKLLGDLKTKDQEKDLEIKKLKENHALELKFKDDEVAFYKDMKAKMSTKAIGESLEIYCHNEFDKIRPNAYPHAYFEKDNDVIDNTKGDFVFRNYDENGTEYLSIMFEMKNEADDTKSKHKNEEFFKKLDEDRKKKGCEYAVLVSLLEQDSDLYNQGIVDVSHKYENMFVVRPQFFIPIIGLLDKASKKNAKAIALLADERQRNLDVTAFENNLLEFKEGFDKNYSTAQKYFEDAIKRIDDTIKSLEKIKGDLTTSNRQLRLANDKAQDLTIKRLTKNSPTVAAKFNAIEAEAEEK